MKERNQFNKTVEDLHNFKKNGITMETLPLMLSSVEIDRVSALADDRFLMSYQEEGAREGMKKYLDYNLFC